MLRHPGFDPVAVEIGPLKVRWYGLMYVLGFLAAWWLGRRRAARPGSGWDPAEVGDLLVYAAFGVILGGRLGYVLFYGLETALADPLWALRVWEGGMSFHGGLLGVVVALWLYGRRTGRGFWAVADFCAPLVPPGLLFGRIGNFINGELWGRPTDLPWGVVFPLAGPEPRHPSQLYEAALEGLVLFAVLWWFTSRPRPPMAASGLFLLLYGIFRFVVELVREPDRHLGHVAFGWMTMGQLLSLPMIVGGAALLAWAWRARPRGGEA